MNREMFVTLFLHKKRAQSRFRPFPARSRLFQLQRVGIRFFPHKAQ